MRCFRLHAAAFSALLFCAFLLSPSLAAQNHPSEYVYHVYVDPIYGDNYLAWRLNPVKPMTTEGSRESVGPGSALLFPVNTVREDRPLQTSYEIISPKNLQGHHYHAPYPFRTITNGQAGEVEPGPTTTVLGGALSWIGTIIGALPATMQTEPTTLTITHVVIHLLPGLYGPIDRDEVTSPPGKEVNSANGLPWNGEVFPIGLPDRVSLQGTSALDTILDARGALTETIEGVPVPLTTAAIIVVVTTTPNVVTHTESFIDGLTIRNAKVVDEFDGAISPASQTQGAGIYIGGEGRVHVKVGNCFFFNNDVGIAIETDTTDEIFPHVPTILNNTFTQNLIGIWNGNRASGFMQTNVGKGEPMICNNVLNARPPDGVIVSAAFSGVHPDDLRTATITYIPSGSTIPVLTPHVVDYNAYQPAAANPTVTLSTYWPPPALRLALPPSPYVPRVDITPWTWGSPRGALFLADTFRLSVVPVSVHDFRLTPRATQNASAPLAGAAGLNPLINQGINLGLNGSGNNVTQITYTPTVGTTSFPRILSPVGIPRPAGRPHRHRRDAALGP